LVKCRLHDIDVFDWSTHVGRAPEQFDLPVRGGVDLDYLAVQLAALVSAPKPVLDSFHLTEDCESDLRRKPCDAPQLVYGPVRHHGAMAQNDDSVCMLAQLGERV
jgi:hypothetical protein